MTDHDLDRDPDLGIDLTACSAEELAATSGGFIAMHAGEPIFDPAPQPPELI